jgi:hypothetical protein
MSVFDLEKLSDEVDTSACPATLDEKLPDEVPTSSFAAFDEKLPDEVPTSSFAAFDEKLRWKASWRFGGEEVASYRKTRSSRTFAYSAKQEALRWIWLEWCQWFKWNDGSSFWEEEYDDGQLTKPKPDLPREQLKPRLEEVRLFMRDQRGFRWRRDLGLEEVE